jgi:hypothetical protein
LACRAAASRHPRRIGCGQIVVPARRTVSTARARRPKLSSVAGDPAGAGGDLRGSLLSAARRRISGGQDTDSTADLRPVIQVGAAKLKPLLQALAEKATPMAANGGVKSKPPTLILSIDQGEELFSAEAQTEAKPFLTMLRDLIATDEPALIAVFTIRSDNYERLQLAPELAEVVKGPARRAAR